MIRLSGHPVASLSSWPSRLWECKLYLNELEFLPIENSLGFICFYCQHKQNNGSVDLLIFCLSIFVIINNFNRIMHIYSWTIFHYVAQYYYPNPIELCDLRLERNPTVKYRIYRYKEISMLVVI